MTDPSGAAVPGAKVVVTDPATAQARTVETNATGYDLVASLNPATYMVTVEQRGFKKITQSSVVLQASQSLTLNILLEVGATSESVTGAADPRILQFALKVTF